MTVPLIVLAILSVVAIGMLMNGWIQGWLESTTGQHAHETPLLNFTPVGLLTLAVVAVGVLLGWWLHKGRIPRDEPATGNLLLLAGLAVTSTATRSTSTSSSAPRWAWPAASPRFTATLSF